MHQSVPIVRANLAERFREPSFNIGDVALADQTLHQTKRRISKFLPPMAIDASKIALFKPSNVSNKNNLLPVFLASDARIAAVFPCKRQARRRLLLFFLLGPDLRSTLERNTEQNLRRCYLGFLLSMVRCIQLLRRAPSWSSFRAPMKSVRNI